MTKTQIWAEVQALLVEHKASKKLASALEILLAPKASGGGQANPPKEIDGTMHYYCRFHQTYEPEVDMVMSAGKPKGYCKASISRWNKTSTSIKQLEAKAVEAMANGDFESAKASAEEAQKLKLMLNSPSNYDFVADWELFRA